MVLRVYWRVVGRSWFSLGFAVRIVQFALLELLHLVFGFRVGSWL